MPSASPPPRRTSLSLVVAFICGFAASCGSGGSEVGVGSDLPILGDGVGDSGASSDPGGQAGDRGFDPGTVDPGGGAADGSDAGPDVIEPGAFGWPCIGNEDCTSGFCVESAGGPICTKTCLTDCPEDFACRSVENSFPDLIFVCVPLNQRLCRACQADFQCAGGRCEQVGDRKACTVPCETVADCPGGFVCGPSELDVSLRCLPASGSCDCLPKDAGTERPCTLSTPIGTCTGKRVCDPELGFAPCDAPEAVPEICDGRDNDCDGKIDEDLPGDGSCKLSNAHGACSGSRTCAGPLGWLCDAQVPEAEICNAKDDDCDGYTDEGFVDGAGKYVHDDHCGACNASCSLGFPHAKAVCNPAADPPQCVVVSCDPGFFKLNDFQCIPDDTILCEACNVDADCVLSGARCLELSDGSFCAKPCAEALDCPAGFACADLGGGALFCKPESNACTCTSGNTDLVRSCQVVHTEPGKPTTTCVGTQACTADGWGVCDLPEDTCDGVDNDCNGVVDDAFRDGAGVYFTVGDCGECGNNCAAFSYPNAKPACLLGAGPPLCGFACDDGSFDVDENPANGCECPFVSDLDLPADGVDADCDGVDGEADKAVFVAKDGLDTNPGTRALPMLTVGAAVTRAQQEGRRDVLVATGIYAERLLLRGRVSVYGGYSGDFGTWTPILYETVILGTTVGGSEPGAVNAVGITGAETNFAAFTVFAKSNKKPGGSSYAIYVVDSGGALRIRDNRVVAAGGGDGLRGEDGEEGKPGVPGEPGAGARDIGTQSCNNGNGNHTAKGGAGGAKTCPGGADVRGGRGGDSRCPKHDPPDNNPAENGKDGVHDKPGEGAGGSKGWDLRIGPSSCGSCTIPPQDLSFEAKNGSDGSDGDPGSPGAGASEPGGTVVGGLWFGQDGGSAGDGGHGGGGGGGGGGSGGDGQGV